LKLIRAPTARRNLHRKMLRPSTHPCKCIGSILTEPWNPFELNQIPTTPQRMQPVLGQGNRSSLVTHWRQEHYAIHGCGAGLSFGLAFIPNALTYVEGCVPWGNITIFLNTLGRSGVVEAHFKGIDFPQQLSGTGRQLPEDFVMRGLVLGQHYFSAEFFSGSVVDEDERNLELPSYAAPRAERCLWLRVKLALVSCRTNYMTINS
jgi:hypothetical protein